MLIYWQVERKSMAVHSQLISCTASEVAAMVEGAMRHGTTMELEGLVERRPHPWHGRVQELHLTEAGRAAHARGRAAAIDEFESQLGAGLDPAAREALWRGLRLVAEQVS